MFTFNRIIGFILLAVLVYAVLNVFGVPPEWMPALPTSSRGA
jgi:hypothetical protein